MGKLQKKDIERLLKQKISGLECGKWEHAGSGHLFLNFTYKGECIKVLCGHSMRDVGCTRENTIRNAKEAIAFREKIKADTNKKGESIDK